MKVRNHHFYKQLAVLTALGSLSQTSWAGGFLLIEQNVTNLGTAYAGSASLAEDASTNYYNSAGLTRLNQEQIVAGGVLVIPNTKLQVDNAVSTFGTPLSPSSGQTRPSDNALIPSLHYAKRINEGWVFGFSATPIFGSKTIYKNDSIARYMATRSEMMTVNLGPSLAYECGHGFSLGAGVDAAYLIAKLDSRIGFGNTSTDGFSENTVSNWGVGYHIGALYEMTDDTRFGLQFRSKLSVKGKGDSLTQFSSVAPLVRQGVKANIDLPESVLFSLYHAFNDQWAVMSDVQWTRWNRFKQVNLTYDNGTQQIAPENYKNNYRVSLGGSYQYNERWRLKAGALFDKSASRDGYRNIMIPEQDITAGALGAQYRVSSALAVEFGYLHAFYKNANIRQVAPTAVNAPQGAQSLNGTVKNQMDLFGLQLTWDIKA